MSEYVVRLSRQAMGTEFRAVLLGADPAYLRDAGTQALDEIERLDAQLSHYRLDSDICGLNERAAFAPVRVEPGLLRLLERALHLSQATGGAFDITLGALIRCWGFFRGQGRMPGEAEIEAARESCGHQWVEIDLEQRTARFRREGLQLHLGAMGKGYALDRAASILRELGVQAALLDGGTSTVYALGAPPEEDGWAVGLCDPRDRNRRLGVVRLRDAALSTSGDYEQFFEWEGARYSHLLDPRTGRPARGTWSAMVTASSATDTDALSTAAFVLGEAEADSVCQRFPDVGVALIPDAGAGDLRLECWGKFPAFLPTADS